MDNSRKREYSEVANADETTESKRIRRTAGYEECDMKEEEIPNAEDVINVQQIVDINILRQMLQTKNGELRHKDDELRQIDDEIRRKDDEIRQKDDEIRQKDDELRKLHESLLRATFLSSLADGEIESFEGLVSRIQELNLPEEEIGDEIVTFDKSYEGKSTIAATLDNTKLNMSKFNYLWLSEEMKQRFPYWQMKIHDAEAKRMIIDNFFSSNETAYNAYMQLFTSTLKSVRRVLRFYLNQGRHCQIEEINHITPIFTLFFRKMMTSLTFQNQAKLRVVLKKPDSFQLVPLPADDHSDPVENISRQCEANRLRFEIDLDCNGVLRSHEVSGYSDVVVTDADNVDRYKMMLELKVPIKSLLHPAATQTIPRGQMFAEMHGFRKRETRSVFVGVMTDLFSLYLLLSEGNDVQPEPGVSSSSQTAASSGVGEQEVSSAVQEATPPAVYISSVRNQLPCETYIMYLLLALYWMDSGEFPDNGVSVELDRQTTALHTAGTSATSTNPSAQPNPVTGSGAGLVTSGSSGIVLVGASSASNKVAGSFVDPSLLRHRRNALSELPVVPFVPPVAEIRFDIDEEEEYDRWLDEMSFVQWLNARLDGESYLNAQSLSKLS